MENRAIFSGKLLPYLLLLPQLAVSLIFFYWPAVQALQQSFLVQDAFGLSTEFVWFENYAELFQRPITIRRSASPSCFRRSWCSLAHAGPLLAVMANRNIAGVQIYRTLLICPMRSRPRSRACSSSSCSSPASA